MFRTFIRKLVKSSHDFVIILLLAALVLCAGPAAASAEESAIETSGGESVPCKDLKPYNNLDELLYQFYINMESDCLFKMPVAALEEIWGIKILDEEQAKPKNYYPLSEIEFYNKPYKSEKDAFYIEVDPNTIGINQNSFIIKITKDYYENHGTLFPNGKISQMYSDSIIKNYPSPGDFSWKSSNGRVRLTFSGDKGITKISLW